MKKDFDVIVVYQLSPVLMAIPAYVAKWFGRTKKIGLYCLDLWPESLTGMGISRSSAFYRFMKFVSIRIYKGVGTIGLSSRLFEKYFTEELGIKNGRFIHIPQFADELFSDIGSDTGDSGKETVDYVFAGNIGKMQSVETVIKAAALTKDDRIRWHIVGDGFALEDCRKLCDSLGVSDRVKFYGRLPVEEMPRFYDMADAVIKYAGGLGGYDHKYLVAYSIGTGVATYTASRSDWDKLVLIAPYNNFTDECCSVLPVFFGPLKAIIKHKFPSDEYAKSISEPTCMIVSDGDMLIRNKLSEKLKAAFKTAPEYIQLTGLTHSEMCYSKEVFRKVAEYLKK